jgi:hypothetical protein
MYSFSFGRQEKKNDIYKKKLKIMKNLSLLSSQCTPSIDFDAETGVCIIEGDSCMQLMQGEVNGVAITETILLENQQGDEVFTITNLLDFFDIIMSWLSEYTQTVNGAIQMHINVVYMDTSSSRRFLELFDLLTSRSLRTLFLSKYLYKNGFFSFILLEKYN